MQHENVKKCVALIFSPYNSAFSLCGVIFQHILRNNTTVYQLYKVAASVYLLPYFSLNNPFLVNA